MGARPLIGCATYHKAADQNPPIVINGLMPTYIQAVYEAGGLPLMIPLGLNSLDLDDILPRLDGLLLPGGGDIDPTAYAGNAHHPTLRDIDEGRDWAEITLTRMAVEKGMPILAICRGLQVFNVALGGTLWEDIQSEMPGAIVHDYFHKRDRTFLAHDVAIEPTSLLAQTLRARTISVNSMHHQGIRRLAPGLIAAGCAPDGLIEAVEVPRHPYAVGVQWHPENLLDVTPRMRSLFAGLVAASSRNGHAA